MLPLAGDAKEILLCSFTPSRQAHFSPGQPSFLCTVCATVYLFPRCKTIIHRNIHHGCFLVDGCELLPISFPPWRYFLPRERKRERKKHNQLLYTLPSNRDGTKFHFAVMQTKLANNFPRHKRTERGEQWTMDKHLSRPDFGVGEAGRVQKCRRLKLFPSFYPKPGPRRGTLVLEALAFSGVCRSTMKRIIYVRKLFFSFWWRVHCYTSLYKKKRRRKFQKPWISNKKYS